MGVDLKTKVRASGSRALAGVARRKLVVLFCIGLLCLIVGVIFLANKDKGDKDGKKGTSEPQTGMMQVGQYYDKQLQCYQDADCPDGTFCNPEGMCVTNQMLPAIQAQPILGRGRAGEGSTYRVSSRTQGQLS